MISQNTGETLDSRAGNESPEKTVSLRKLFSRDLDYLRDMALIWPIFLFSTLGLASVYAPQYREIGLRCLAVAVVALFLAKEKLVVFFSALALAAIHSAIALLLHPWNWIVFIVGVSTATPFLMANRYWRKPKFAYQLPPEFGAIDLLWMFGSICASLFVAYLISPYN